MPIEWIDEQGREHKVSLGLPANLESATLDNLNPRPDIEGWDASVATVHDYIDLYAEYAENGKGLLICGPVGTGKSHMVAAVAIEVYKAGLVSRVIWRDAGRFIRSLAPDVESRRGNLRDYLTENLLVIDDLGGEYRTDWSTGLFEEVISGRYDRQRPTIVTTNLAPDEIQKGYGDRLWDRLRDVNSVVVLAGESYRGARRGIE